MDWEINAAYCVIFCRSVYGVCVLFWNCTRKSYARKERTPKITLMLFIPTGTSCSKTSQFPLSPLDCSRYNCRLTVGYRHLANRMKTMRHNATVANPGPDLQNILRQSYDYLTIMPKLRSTYDERLIYKTSYEGRKAFRIGMIHLQLARL